MVNTIAVHLALEQQRKDKEARKKAEGAEPSLKEARDSIYNAFVITYQERLLRAIMNAHSNLQAEIGFEVLATVGFLFKHKSFGQIILPVGVPDRSTYNVHHTNLYRVEQTILNP